MTLRNTLLLCAAGAVMTGAGGPIDGAATAHPGSAVAELIGRASDAHARLMRGDIAGYRRAIEVTSDFTLMDSFGGRPTGAPKTDEHWQRIGRFFRAGRAAGFEPIATYQSADMIVLVANERAHVAVGALPAQDWSLRVTLVFRREDGVWRLAHRHADPLVKGISLGEAGRMAAGASSAGA